MITTAPTPWGVPLLHTPLLKWWLPLVLVPALLLGFHLRARLSPAARRAYAALMGGTIVAFGALVALRARSNVRTPPEWDVQAFWLYGKVAAAGRNFYLTSAFHDVYAGLAARDPLVTRTEVFSREVLDVGFAYPPPTMLLMAPLGWMELRPAAAAWYALHAVALVVAVVLLWRTFLREERALGLAFAASLVLTFRATYTTFAFGQTSLLMLVCLLAMWPARGRPAGGVYAALGVLVKPVLAFAPAWLLLRRRWAALAASAAAGAALLAASAAAFGLDTVRSYAFEMPALRVPEWLYTVPENQSLVATFVRLADYDFARGTPLAHPLVVGASAAILVLTAWLAARLPDRFDDVALALLVPAALLVYPQSLEHYTVLLLPPLLLLLRRAEDLGLSPGAALALIAVEFALVRYREGAVAVLASGVLWLVLVAASARLIRAGQPGLLGARTLRPRAAGAALAPPTLPAGRHGAGAVAQPSGSGRGA